MEKAKHLGLRIDSETHKKLKSLAEFDGRSMNGEVLYLVRQAISRHEQTYGILTSHEEPCDSNDKERP
ncbi:MAG: Arc family DNA-binding protein [Eubacteriales bacterium]|nr:Arc family DNA-binding protein [Eubacteriales bacterium]